MSVSMTRLFSRRLRPARSSQQLPFRKYLATQVDAGEPKISLHYGDFPGWRAEVCRIPLRLAQIDFEDVRYAPHFSEEMRNAAAKKGAGNAPWLELSDGRVMCQTSAMARYCATRAGLTPTDPFLSCKVDEIIQSCSDLSEGGKSAFLSFYQLGESGHGHKFYKEHVVAKWLGFFEKRLAENGASGLFVGKELTTADIAVWRQIDHLMDPTLIKPFNMGIDLYYIKKNFPLVMRHADLCNAHPGIRSYMERQYPEGKGVNPMPGHGFMENLPEGHWWNLTWRPVKDEAVEFWESKES